MSEANPNVKKLDIKAGPVNFPSATILPIPAVTVATSLVALFHGVRALVTSSSAALVAAGEGAAGGGTAIGAGGRTSPLCRTIDPLTTSSSKLTTKLTFSVMDKKNFVTLLE